MTATEWDACADPEAMLKEFAGVIGARRLRLFACACCRRVWHLIHYDTCREAVEFAEAFADGRHTAVELKAMHVMAQNDKPLFADASWGAACCASPDAREAANEAAFHAAMAVARIAGRAAEGRARAARASGAQADDINAAWERYEQVHEVAGHEEAGAQADLLREIVGNPLAEAANIGPMPLAVMELANALYRGEDCRFALHDALLEADRTDLAEHFTTNAPSHPRGWWLLDALRGAT